jgi:hypothetical protein
LDPAATHLCKCCAKIAATRLGNPISVSKNPILLPPVPNRTASYIYHSLRTTTTTTSTTSPPCPLLSCVLWLDSTISSTIHCTILPKTYHHSRLLGFVIHHLILYLLASDRHFTPVHSSLQLLLLQTSPLLQTHRHKSFFSLAYSVGFERVQRQLIIHFAFQSLDPISIRPP